MFLRLVYESFRRQKRRKLLAGIAMAMSLLPEEFPVVLTIFLALGAWRISRSRVLTRRMPVIEMLGAATVLCVDKTGTLTQNRMTVKALATQTEPTAKSLDKPTSSLDQTGAIEYLMSLLFYGVSATNMFDSNGHLARSEPQVGLSAVTPQQCAGIRTEPPVSEPSAANAQPLATRAADPLDDPPAM